MLFIGKYQKSVLWPEANITLTLSPLTNSQNQEFRDQHTDDDGKLQFVPYAKAVGRACIKGWEGVVAQTDSGAEAVPCTPENIDALMQIDPAAAFVLDKVRTLAIQADAKIAEAGNG
jgi:hypothetical protein